MVEVADVVLRGSESVGFVYDELGLVVEPFHGSIVDRHSEIVQDATLVVAQHPRSDDGPPACCPVR